ncbi:large-conductance mechanosensitive channel protein MscL [Pedobacter cryotolerans]|uniref:Large-conductance mechanosensitive channel n=1 Tax=Pedobacter cryotolerans TaxID=2571270 RepID=A0A4U1C7C9_9SPHI|nr:large-conductance mechanosensitive channel protein MscL [Pedobacter cryotolerans]TKC01361.1 large-conductance mechanosensitive channel protein MscL [Pedobacter cryotolerans]
MGIVKEFKEFAVKGNVLDLAVGVIIGAAFGKIVSSLVEDIITPAVLGPALKAAGLQNLSELTIAGTAIKYGNFLSQVISFIIVAFVLFLVIKGANNLKKKEVAAPSVPTPPTKEEILLTEIRDLLKTK